MVNTICSVTLVATFQTLTTAGLRRLRVLIERIVRTTAAYNEVWNTFFIIISCSIGKLVVVIVSITRATLVVVVVVFAHHHRPCRRKHRNLFICIGLDFTFRRCQHTCRLVEYIRQQTQCIGRLVVFMRSGHCRRFTWYHRRC